MLPQQPPGLGFICRVTQWPEQDAAFLYQHYNQSPTPESYTPEERDAEHALHWQVKEINGTELNNVDQPPTGCDLCGGVR